MKLDRELNDNDNVELLKIRVPDHESDPALNIAYNVLSGGTCLEDIERLRNEETYTKEVLYLVNRVLYRRADAYRFRGVNGDAVAHVPGLKPALVPNGRNIPPLLGL